MYKSYGIEQINRLGTQSVDIHRLATDEMLNATFDLWRTRHIVGAKNGCFTFDTHQRCTTLRTSGNETYLLTHHERTGRKVNSRNLGDNLPTLLHIHHITDMQVEVVHKIGIMECGTLDHGT